MSMSLNRREALAVMAGAFLCPENLTNPVDKAILPVRGEVRVYHDDTPRPRRTGIYAKSVMGFAVLDNRRVLSAKF